MAEEKALVVSKSLLEQPYASRQLIIVVDDVLVEQARKTGRGQPEPMTFSGGNAAIVAVSVASTALGVATGLPIGALGGLLASLIRSMTKMQEEGAPVLVVEVSSRFARVLAVILLWNRKS